MWPELEAAFQALCAEEGRPGVISAVPLSEVRLLPEQKAYLLGKVAPLKSSGQDVSAISLGIAYHQEETDAVPPGWVARKPADGRWNRYARAYQDLNRCLNRISATLAERFGGVAEGATLTGLVNQVTHVSQYFPLCVSHRAVAETAGLGWRGKHGLIVTPEFGPALRLATVFLPGSLASPVRQLAGCGVCDACLEVCPVLRKGTAYSDLNRYREMCRRRIDALALDDEVCGICVRRCRGVVLSMAPTGPTLTSA